MKPRYIVNVEAAIVRDGRYLLIVRGPGACVSPGTLSLPGGKVEGAGQIEDILEETARREAVEEVGVTLDATLAYVRSVAFVSDEGDPVVDIVLLGRYAGGEPIVFDSEEVAAFRWLTADEVAADPHAPPWTRRSVELAEATRLRLGW
jgi:8-oxo-dGTP diphosphatase